MKKFNNTLEGTDCGDAGMPARGRDVTKATSVLRVVPNTPEIESIAPGSTSPNACDSAESAHLAAARTQRHPAAAVQDRFPTKSHPSRGPLGDT